MTDFLELAPFEEERGNAQAWIDGFSDSIYSDIFGPDEQMATETMIDIMKNQANEVWRPVGKQSYDKYIEGYKMASIVLLEVLTGSKNV